MYFILIVTIYLLILLLFAFSLNICVIYSVVLLYSTCPFFLSPYYVLFICFAFVTQFYGSFYSGWLFGPLGFSGLGR